MSGSYTIQAEGGAITIAAPVLEQVVIGSAEAVEGARVRRPRRGLEVEVENGRARVTVELAVRYGHLVPDVAHRVQRLVGESLGGMCGLETSAVDVAIEEIDGA